AGVFGSWLGATILDEKKTRSALWAAMRGLAVAALSYFFLFAVELFVAVLYNDNIDSDGFFRLISVIALTFLIALLVFGWLIAVTGAAAGALLYLFQNKTTESGTNRNSLSDK
ncbi:MAG: hypothetical protein ABI999_02715, partial [Acidobacteriota bacterium]